MAQQRDHEVRIAEIAKDFGIHEGTLTKWLRQADLDGGNPGEREPGPSTNEKTEPRTGTKGLRSSAAAGSIPMAGWCAIRRRLLKV